MKRINYVLKEILSEIKIPERDLKIIELNLNNFIKNLGERIKRKKISAEIFVCGSFAKRTMIKKEIYDIDIFVRYDKKYGNEEISKITETLLKGTKNTSKIHGSRDYFRIKKNKNLVLEIIPVKKIRFQEEAENITDLSYSHVRYIRKKIKNKNILDGILLAKAFCYANKCYGAESYIKGFSGYSLELLIYRYKSFLKFIKEVIKISDKKEIIDIEKYYKNKNLVLMDINSAKLQSPIILIDPTYKQRNVLSALSEETFKNFQRACANFLRKPSKEMFKNKKTDFVKFRKISKKKKQDSVLIEIKTEKREGDVAGSKLLKFYNHLSNEIEKTFKIEKKNFEYLGGNSAKCFFSVKRKKEIIKKGPKIDDLENLKKFRKKHSRTFLKNGRIYSKIIPKFKLDNFIKNWNGKNKKKIKEMHINSMRFLD